MGNEKYTLCAECSEMVGEPLAATTPRTLHWLLLEYDGAWEANALAASSLPDPIKAHLNAQMEQLGDARFQFIKRSGTRQGIRFYAVCTRPGQTALYRFDLVNYDELLVIDLKPVMEGKHPELRVSEQLMLVCTNGKKDIACAKLGIPLVQALETEFKGKVWQTTHIGGHRFAGTLVTLPDGHYYGRVSPAEVPALAAAVREGRIAPAHYRGRCGLPPPAQAAEIALRERLDLWDMDEVSVADVELLGENLWRVTVTSDGADYPLRVTGGLSEFEILESSADSAFKRVMQYAVEAE